jgi:hypothetical protein
MTMKNISIIFLLLIQFMGIKANAQSLVSISPNTGEAGQSVAVTITGSGTSFGPTTQVVLNQGINIIAASNIQVVSSTVITATLNIPANAASGSYMLVANSGLNFLQLPDAFTVTGGSGPSASIVSISPDHGNKGQTLLVNITGANTSFTQSTNTTVTLVAAGMPIIATGVFPISNTQLACLISIPSNAASGAHSLVVTTSNDGVLLKPLAFTVDGGSSSPELTSITPSSGARGQSLDVTITGANTEFMQSSDVTVTLFGGASPIMADFAVAMSNTEIWASITIPADESLGLHDLGVWTSNQGALSLPSSFTVTGTGGTPQLVSVAPSFGARGQTLDVTITGANTSFAQATNSLMVYLYDQATGISANFVNALSNTELVANFTIPSDLAQGLYGVGVYSDPDGWLELANSFTIVETGLFEPDAPQTIKAYPNPVKETLLFESEADVQSIVLMDITGKQTLVPMADVTVPDQHTYSFNVRQLNLNKGIYFLRVETDQGPVYQKILVE